MNTTINENRYVFDESLGYQMEDKDFKFVRFLEWNEEAIFPMYYYYFQYKGMEVCIEVDVFYNHKPAHIIIHSHLPEKIVRHDMNSFSFLRALTKKCAQLMLTLKEKTNYEIGLNRLEDDLNRSYPVAFVQFLIYRYEMLECDKTYQKIVRCSERLKDWCVKKKVKTITLDVVMKELKLTEGEASDCLRHSDVDRREAGFLQYERNEKKEELWHFVG